MRSIESLYTIGFAALLLVPAIGASQDNKDKLSIPQPDLPGKVHKQMEPMAGNWDVDITFVINGHENHGKVTCEAKWILDGRFLRQEYHSSLMGKPYTVIQHLGYDNQKKKIIELKMDNMSTGIMHNEGIISDDGKTITNEGEIQDPATGKTSKLRTVYTIIDPDHFTLEWFMIGADGKAEKGVSMTHTRRKP
jgi:uncharacterized protein DUF1579